MTSASWRSTASPAEPFPARNGALVLAPGGRVDAFIDATAPAGLDILDPAARRQGSAPDRPAGRPQRSRRSAPRRCAAAPPLPSNGLPAQLDLKNALRIDLPLGGPQAELGRARQPSQPPLAPAFRAKAGRTVVLALTNRGDIATVFHLHGHHFRLLDRLDDGWKPFWLDTLAIEPGQTQRIAFRRRTCRALADESIGNRLGGAAPVRWYSCRVRNKK